MELVRIGGVYRTRPQRLACCLDMNTFRRHYQVDYVRHDIDTDRTTGQ